LEHNVHLPHGVLCLAGSGGSFHGFRQRPWLAPAGNIYLTASFTPNRAIENFGAGFLTLAAVSVVDAIDKIPGLAGRAKIKWVNDILIDNAKVCGVLAYTQQEGDKVTGASLGIGLNVLATPKVDPTIFVPQAGSLVEFADDKDGLKLADVFRYLYESLEQNYHLLIESGAKSLLDKYRRNSLVINCPVKIYDDVVGDNLQLLHKGVVISIGNHLELKLQGVAKPITRGRLALEE
jgi:BirA family biotin operon repressor/biotin-[acetyl-CoA-carboxylase] ligase